MKLYIIIILICFIIILYFVDEIKLIYKIVYCSDLSNFHNIKFNNILDKLLFMYYNPCLIKLYKQILIDLKKIKKYDNKSYYTQLNINISEDNLLFFDYYIITYGIIKLAQDTIIKLIKIKQTIPKNLIKLINRLYNYYYIIEKSLKNINITNLNKFKNKKYKHDILIKLYKIEELIYNLFTKNYKNLNLNPKFNKIIETSITDKNINTINSKFNIKFNKKNKTYKKNNLLINFF